MASDFAFANDAAVDIINLTIPEACTLSTPAGSGQTYNAQLANGQYKNDIGKTRLSVFCNTQDSFAVYAIGYSNDTIGSTDMITTTSGATNILTGTATSGDTSNWAMKIEAVDGNGTDIYTPTIQNPFNDFTSVPSSYAKIAEVTSATTRTVEGAIDATYQVYISPNQQAGAYTGKVRYTVVHPASVDPSAGQANLDRDDTINKKLKSLASGTNVTGIGTGDNLITAFVRSDTLPANFIPSDANTISASNSLAPVYVWFDSNDGTMYYYSKAKDIYMHYSSASLFSLMRSLTDISGLKYFIADNVEYTHSMFAHTQISDLTPLANWDVSNVTDMSGMFQYTQISDLTPLANWDVSNVTNMKSMFYSAQISDLTPLANWNTSSVTTFGSLFSGCTLLTDISGLEKWDISKVSNISWMFANTSISDLAPIAEWDISKITDMSSLFQNNKALTDLTAIAQWNIGSVTNINQMFLGSGISNLTPIANWNISSVTSMSSTFSGTQISDLTPLANWNTSNVTTMQRLFSQTQISDLTPIKNWNIKNVTNLFEMFDSIPTLVNSSPISEWDVGKVEHTGEEYKGFHRMFGRSTPKTNLPIFTSRPGTWDANGTYIPN